MSTVVSPEDLRRLAKIKNLNVLVMTSGCTTDEHLLVLFESLGAYPHLQALVMNGPKFTSTAALAGLTRHTALRSLQLGRSDQPGDDALAVLAKLSDLSSLRLESTALTDDVFDHLAPLAELRLLQVRSPKVTGSKLAGLASLAHLDQLSLAGCRLTDDSLAALAKASRLTRLDLSDTPVTDACLRHLAACPSLRTVKLTNSHVTRAGIARLRRELPDCLIFTNLAASPSATTSGSPQPPK
jgi:Leucine-rich repeat (LRR) protein